LGWRAFLFVKRVFEGFLKNRVKEVRYVYIFITQLAPAGGNGYILKSKKEFI